MNSLALRHVFMTIFLGIQQSRLRTAVTSILDKVVTSVIQRNSACCKKILKHRYVYASGPQMNLKFYDLIFDITIASVMTHLSNITTPPKSPPFWFLIIFGKSFRWNPSNPSYNKTSGISHQCTRFLWTAHNLSQSDWL